ncbi:GNAT family N-acetyltransferase [Chitinimonas koreensis]|uniref:GNAT family N-acetyltransferase n=1 Tax=Chitinimonas koreensis TaxID=356302 RepID=UPI0004028BC6|nr:GNAT family N-acetyltransferase [Chitinimonas koreensis]QNM96597.1 GNAT family N-acetyltransferase [Chitinimonas koreensis]
MSLFSRTIESFWQDAFRGSDVLCRNDALTVALDPGLDEDRRVMLLRAADGKVRAVLTPALADKIRLDRGPDLTEAGLRQKLHDGGIQLHGADYVFHFAEADKQALLQETPPAALRRLSGADEAAFAAFQSAASEQDLDDAYVELDHWAVFGAFEQDCLVCAASMYPWAGQRIADTGVLTLPPARGRGHARRVVRAIGRHACNQGYEPQYRCQTDNRASVALARAAGLTLFASWEVVSPDSAE